MRIRSRAYGSDVTASDACTTFGSGETRDYIFTINNSLGIGTTIKKEMLKVYPNPTSDYINIETVTTIKELTVYNILGQLVIHSTVNKVDVSGLPNGTFIVEVLLNDGQKRYSKIVKK
jgi:hypothetical protein